MRPIFCLITLLLALGAFARSADPTLAKLIPRAMPEAVVRDTPWGAAVDGLQCRLLLLPRYVVGEPIWAEVEVKNVSAVERLVPRIFTIYFPKFATLTITGPKGTTLPLENHGEMPLLPRMIQPLAPGATARLVLPDVGQFFSAWNPVTRRMETPFDTIGAYTATYTLTLPPLPSRLLESTTYDSKGNHTENYQEYTPEQQAAAWHGTVLSAPTHFTVDTPTAKDLTVHEWGVFTCFPDMQYANANRKAEWGALPPVFYHQFPTQRLRWIPSAWDKPVIDFFTPHDSLRCQVSVDFGVGYPVVWWPCAADPVDRGGYSEQAAPTFHKLRWDLTLGTHLPHELLNNWEHNGWRPATLYPLPATSWPTQARVPSAALVTADGSTVERSAPWVSGQVETERFLYYDGLVPAPEYLHCTAEDAKSVTLTSAAAFPLAPLFVVDRRGAGVRFARVDALAPGATRKIVPTAVADAKWPVTGMTEVGEALRTAGLFPEEADALLKIWQDGLFTRPGVTVFYLLPQTEYDRLLPLTIAPKPPKLVRVGIAVHPNCETEPALTALAQALIAQLADADEKTRLAAASRLTDLGPVAIRLLREALKTHVAPELQARYQQVLDAVDVSTYFTPPHPAAAAGG